MVGTGTEVIGKLVRKYGFTIVLCDTDGLSGTSLSLKISTVLENVVFLSLSFLTNQLPFFSVTFMGYLICLEILQSFPKYRASFLKV